MTWILMSIQFLRFYHFLNTRSSFSLSFWPFSISDNAFSISKSSFWMVSSASSLNLAFFLYFLHHILCSNLVFVSIFRFHTNILYVSFFLMCYDTLILLYILRYIYIIDICFDGWYIWWFADDCDILFSTI